ncbi:MAG: exodeoxyribonuclease V subunit gamma, partial [Luteimonas sp.]|nr:exodeoxyribonuclease V subunit gamma [Luteimonas sp.]
RQRLQLRLPEPEAAGEDIEPLQAPARGLPRSQLQRAVFGRLLAGDAVAAMHAPLRARGLLPSGPPGRRALQEIVAEVAPYAEAFAAWRGDAVAESRLLDLDIDGVRVHGRIDDVFAGGIARLRFGTRNGPSVIRNGLDWLLAQAAGVDAPFIEFHETDTGIGPHLRAAIPRGMAVDALRALLALRRDGLQGPLPFAPYSAWELFDAATLERGLDKAANRWRGSGHVWAEGEGEALRLALRGRDPFADAASLREFARIAGLVFGAVTAGTPAPIEIGDAEAPDDDVEDAA